MSLEQRMIEFMGRPDDSDEWKAVAAMPELQTMGALKAKKLAAIEKFARGESSDASAAKQDIADIEAIEIALSNIIMTSPQMQALKRKRGATLKAAGLEAIAEGKMSSMEEFSVSVFEKL